MNKTLLASLLLFTLPTLANSNVADNKMQTALNAEAKTKIQAFAKQLKSTLKAGVKQGGAVQGIEVCNSSAISIAQAHANDGWQIGRTSLKLRNSDNQPDNWELKQLNDFEAKKAKGADIKTLVASEIITDTNGNQQFRFIKAIPTGKLCLGCHGSNIKPEIQAKLNQLYPNDQATGFKDGDIRGAFTLTKALSN